VSAENLRRVAHELRADPDSYDQTQWENPDCGSPGCVAGFAELLIARERGWDSWKYIPSDLIAEWFGLDVFQANRLFHAEPFLDGLWPEPFAGRYRAAMDGSGEPPAFVAADLLDALADGTVTL
jgi:hypothetical protein